jgi:CheY-like chemotaxis protein
VLIGHGYHVDAAENGAVAWDALQANRYDLMITDNAMPHLTGIGLLKKLRGARMTLPVIMATGSLPRAAFALQPWLQPSAMVIKPYTSPELVAAVVRVLDAGSATTQ